jgi:NAD(P)-dependent dehydrogenase (short-subunit alcohol dehydrogenase family)
MAQVWGLPHSPWHRRDRSGAAGHAGGRRRGDRKRQLGDARAALPGVGAYAATKSAVNMLSAVARAEPAPDAIAEVAGLVT